jgi:hypothetical protein
MDGVTVKADIIPPTKVTLSSGVTRTIECHPDRGSRFGVLLDSFSDIISGEASILLNVEDDAVDKFYQVNAKFKCALTDRTTERFTLRVSSQSPDGVLSTDFSNLIYFQRNGEGKTEWFRIPAPTIVFLPKQSVLRITVHQEPSEEISLVEGNILITGILISCDEV